MIASKFGIGQQVRHSLLGYLGVVVDIDPVYSLSEPSPDELAVNDELRAAPWYHVVMEDDNGLPVHTYLAEAQHQGLLRPGGAGQQGSHGHAGQGGSNGATVHFHHLVSCL